MKTNDCFARTQKLMDAAKLWAVGTIERIDIEYCYLTGYYTLYCWSIETICDVNVRHQFSVEEIDDGIKIQKKH